LPSCLVAALLYLHLHADLGLQQWQLHGGDAIEAVNRLYDLVQQHQRVQEEREAAQDELHKAKVCLQLQQLHVPRTWFTNALGSRCCAAKLHNARHNLTMHPLALIAVLCCAMLYQVDGKVSNKTIQRLQGQVEAREQELGALNIKVCAPFWLHCLRCLTQTAGCS
jgi:hypothetical protein